MIGATISYESLSNELKAKKQQLKGLPKLPTTVKIRAALKSRIMFINDQLTKIDKSVGVHCRPMGNYKSA